MGHVPNAHPGGWDSTGVEPYEIHLEATVRDPEAFRRAAKVRAYLYRQGVDVEELAVYWDGGYGNVQILLTDRLGDNWPMFREATDVEGIQYVGDGRSYCTEAFVDDLPEAPVREKGENAVACGTPGCRRETDPRPVEHPDRGTRILCRYHQKHYLGVTS